MSTKQELIDKQPRFWELLAGGSTLTAACEAVRVHRATGRKWRLATGRRSVDVPPGTGIGPTVRAVSAGSDHRSPVAIYGQLLYSRRQPHWPPSTSHRRPSTPRTAPAYRSGPSSTTSTTPQIRTVLRRPIELAIRLRTPGLGSDASGHRSLSDTTTKPQSRLKSCDLRVKVGERERWPG